MPPHLRRVVSPEALGGARALPGLSLLLLLGPSLLSCAADADRPAAAQPADARPSPSAGGLHRVIPGREISTLADLAALRAECRSGPVVVDGDLSFRGNQLVQVSRLGCIKRVQGSLSFQSAPNLAVVQLHGLNTVEGDLTLYDLDSLAIISFPSLRAIDGSLALYAGDSLTRLAGLDALATVGDSFHLVLDGAEVGVETFNALVEADDIAIHVSQGVRAWHAFAALSLTRNLTVFVSGTESTPSVSPSFPALSQVERILSLQPTWWEGGLAAFPALEAVEELRIQDSEGLVDFTGMGSLRSVYDLYLEQNVDLESADGVAPGAAISHYFEASNNETLTDIDAFQGAEWIGADIQRSPQFGSLAFMAGVIHGGSIVLQDTEALTDLEELSSLETVGWLHLDNNTELSSLAGLEALTQASGSIVITNCPNLASIEALSQVEQIGGRFELSGSSIHDVVDLVSLTELRGGGLYLRDVEGAVEFPLLEAVNDDVQLGTPDSLNMPRLVTVNGELDISSIDGLTEVRLPLLEAVDDSLLCRDNPDLRTLELGALRSVGGYLTIEGSTGDRLDLASLQEVGLNLNLRGLSRATEVDLASLVAIDGHFEFIDNLTPTTLSAPLLTEVAGDLRIDDNAVLHNLDGLSALHAVGGDLSVQGNDSLVQAEAEAWAAALEVDGSVTVSGNSGG